MTDKILAFLMAGEYVSGEDISRKLGISRSAVWKHICKLKKRGYKIESVTNKGYFLKESINIAEKSVISNYLTTDFIGRKMYIYDETESTNIKAKENSNESNGAVFVSRIQTKGRGRLGRSWESGKDGLWFSILLKPHIASEYVSLLTLIAGLAVCDAAGDKSAIKWPNDIVIGGKKVCGILTELSAEIDCINYVVCGIGINVYNKSFSDELSDKATSLYIEGYKDIDINKLLADILNKFEEYYRIFIKDGFEALSESYRKKCMTIGKNVTAIGAKSTVTGTAVDITSSGALVINSNGKCITLSSGEVSVRGIYGYI